MTSVDPPLKPNPAASLVANNASVAGLRAAAATCMACPLYARATQTVFGEGNPHPQMVLVGEQPGDAEDQEGSPFVGPAGKLLWQAVTDAGIPLGEVYATNVVKHFKWTESGWRRLHAKPNRREVEACKPWFEAEIELLQPRIIVGLGATACQALLGPKIRVTKERGEIGSWGNYPLLISLHPSAILRARDGEARKKMMGELVIDLEKAHQRASG